MWISLKAEKPFAIQIFVGGVNAVSGEPIGEDEATLMRRLTLMEKKKSIQDYVVTPDQLWLDGIATGNGRVRQFVAMPLGSGYSVEARTYILELILPVWHYDQIARYVLGGGGGGGSTSRNQFCNSTSSLSEQC